MHQHGPLLYMSLYVIQFFNDMFSQVMKEALELGSFSAAKGLGGSMCSFVSWAKPTNAHFSVTFLAREDEWKCTGT